MVFPIFCLIVFDGFHVCFYGFCRLVHWSFGFVILLINNNNPQTTLRKQAGEVERYYSITMNIFVYVCCVLSGSPVRSRESITGIILNAVLCFGLGPPVVLFVVHFWGHERQASACAAPRELLGGGSPEMLGSGCTTLKSNIDTQNDAMFERRYIFQGPSFLVSTC